MNSRTGRAVRLGIFTVLLISGPCLGAAQSARPSLTLQVTDFDSDNASPVGQRIELAQASKVPMGIEWLDVLNEKPSPPQHMRRVTLRQILYSILRQYPGYTFELNNGVIEVFATRLARDEKNFLNIRIPQFHLDRVNLYQASYELGNAIRDVVQPRPGYGGGFGQPPNPRTGFDVSNISLVTHNLAVRRVLDRIAAAQGNAVWV